MTLPLALRRPLLFIAIAAGLTAPARAEDGVSDTEIRL